MPLYLTTVKPSTDFARIGLVMARTEHDAMHLARSAYEAKYYVESCRARELPVEDVSPDKPHEGCGCFFDVKKSTFTPDGMPSDGPDAFVALSCIRRTPKSRPIYDISLVCATNAEEAHEVASKKASDCPFVATPCIVGPCVVRSVSGIDGYVELLHAAD